MAEEAEVPHGFLLLLFMACNAFISSAFVEESTKLLVRAMHSRHAAFRCTHVYVVPSRFVFVLVGWFFWVRRTQVLRERLLKVPLCLQPMEHADFSAYTTLILLIAISLGVSTATDVMFLFGPCAPQYAFSHACASPTTLPLFVALVSAGETHESIGDALTTALLRSIVSLPVQTVSVMLTALMTARRDLQLPGRQLSVWRTLLPAVVLHGSYAVLCVFSRAHTPSHDAFRPLCCTSVASQV